MFRYCADLFFCFSLAVSSGVGGEKKGGVDSWSRVPCCNLVFRRGVPRGFGLWCLRAVFFGGEIGSVCMFGPSRVVCRCFHGIATVERGGKEEGIMEKGRRG